MIEQPSTTCHKTDSTETHTTRITHAVVVSPICPTSKTPKYSMPRREKRLTSC